MTPGPEAEASESAPRAASTGACVSGFGELSIDVKCREEHEESTKPSALSATRGRRLLEPLRSRCTLSRRRCATVRVGGRGKRGEKIRTKGRLGFRRGIGRDAEHTRRLADAGRLVCIACNATNELGTVV